MREEQKSISIMSETNAVYWFLMIIWLRNYLTPCENLL